MLKRKWQDAELISTVPAFKDLVTLLKALPCSRAIFSHLSARVRLERLVASHSRRHAAENWLPRNRFSRRRATRR